MKVTAIIADELIEEVKKLSKGKNITEAITIALKEWTALNRIKELNRIVRESPLEFNARFYVEDVRENSRKER